MCLQSILQGVLEDILDPSMGAEGLWMSVEIFWSLGGLEASNSLTSVGIEFS